MQFLTSKTGILTTLLIALFAFLYFFTGVFGETRIGLTLRTNPDLENGLVAHYTFDATDVSGFTVSDSSGNGNDGSIVATSTQGEVAVDTSSQPSTGNVDGPMPLSVWISDQEGFKVYNDAGNDVFLASTTDGGTTWGNFQQVDNINTADVFTVSVWYDGWTNDQSGNLIHIATIDAGESEIYYTQYDTLTNTLSSTATTTLGTASFGADNSVYITKSEDGVLYVMAVDSLGGADTLFSSCSLDCTIQSSWTSLTSEFDATHGIIHATLLPMVGTNNIVMVYRSDEDNLMVSNVYSATSSSWWGQDIFTTSVEEPVSEDDSYMATYYKKTGSIYVALLDDTDDYITEDHDIDFWAYNNSTYTWTEKTNVITNASGGISAVAISIDENRGTLYVVYVRRTTIGTPSTSNVYFKFSEDEGTTWSSEIGPLDSVSAENIVKLDTTLMSNERITASFDYDLLNDVYVTTIADIGDYADEKPTVGNIGQAIEFDGVDDYIDFGNLANVNNIDEKTITAWIFMDNGPASNEKSTILNKEQGANNGYSFTVCNNRSDGGCLGLTNTLSFTQGFTTSPGRWVTESNTIREGEWQHVAVTYASSSATNNPIFYIDGSSVAIANEDTPVGNSRGDTGQDVSIGARLFADQLFDGKIDDVRIYNRILSASEISRLYGLGATTKISKTITTNSDLEDGLVYHATFDATDLDIGSSTGEIVDRTGISNNGDWQDHASTTVPGVIGQAIEFDGADGIIEAGSESALDDLSIVSVSTWIYPRSAGENNDNGYIVSKSQGPGSVGWVFRLDNAPGSPQLNFEVDYTTTNLFRESAAGVLRLNEWQHVVTTWTGSTSAAEALIYLNGEEVSSYDTTINGSGTRTSDSGTSLRIGNVPAQNRTFDGFIDDVRVYSRVIPPSEVKRLYELGATTKIAKTITTNPDLENGLVAHYTFDGPDVDIGSNTAEIKDRSGSGNDGDWLNHATTTTFGKIGQAIEFDGVDDYVDFGSPASLDNIDLLTTSAWIYINSSSADRIYDKNDGSTVGHRLQYVDSEGEIRFYRGYSGGSGWWATPNNSIRLNEWIHIAVTQDRTGLNTPDMYINGESVAVTEVSAPGGTANDDSVQPVIIGGRNGAVNLWDGKIDDMRFYDRILSASEILRLYQLGGGN